MTDINADEIARHYGAMLDSLMMIERLQASEDDEEDTREVIERNKEHLKLMLGKPFWTDQDMTAIEAIVA